MSSHLPLRLALKSNDVLSHCRGWCWGDTGMLGCTTLWPNLLRVRLGITGMKCPAVITWHIRELPLPAHLPSASLLSERPAPHHRQLLKGSVRRWQLKVQTSLPHCSLCEWPCLCNTEDVLNGRAQAVNHHIITPGVSQPQCIIKPSFGSSNHLSLTHHHHTGFSQRRLAWSESRAN